MQELHSFPSKSSAGFDGLSIKLLKLVYSIESKPLLLFINKLFTSVCFPDLLKNTRVVPIFKGGSPDDLMNYRPISILPSLSTIFERLINACKATALH